MLPYLCNHLLAPVSFHVCASLHRAAGADVHNTPSLLPPYKGMQGVKYGLWSGGGVAPQRLASQQAEEKGLKEDGGISFPLHSRARVLALTWTPLTAFLT
jgi:hypothetical protein